MYDTALQEIRLFRSWRGEKTDEKVECKSKAQTKQKQARARGKQKAKSKGMKATSSPTKAWMQ